MSLNDAGESRLNNSSRLCPWMMWVNQDLMTRQDFPFLIFIPFVYRLAREDGGGSPSRGKIWSRMQASEAHQRRDDLVPNAGTRSSPEEGRTGPECRHQKLTRRGKNWSRMQAPEAHQRRDDLVPYAGTRGPPEEGGSGPECRRQKPPEEGRTGPECRHQKPPEEGRTGPECRHRKPPEEECSGPECRLQKLARGHYIHSR